MKYIILALLALILASLGGALYSMVKDKGQSKRTVKFLSMRITLSIALFLIILIGITTGIIVPHATPS
ncbi:MAG: twin transmembrane helix small protein [Thiohalomonadales bacterium]